MKHYVYRILLLSVVMEIGSSMSLCCGKRSAEIEELYKKIGEELISVRKEFVQAQPKIYLVLDQLDKMYGIAKTGLQKKKEIKQYEQRLIPHQKLQFVSYYHFHCIDIQVNNILVLIQDNNVQK